MSEAVFEFPLKEKMRNYLRVEQLLGQLKSAASPQNNQLQLVFFSQLFDLMDLIERLDLRADISKDLDTHEKNLVFWSQHPKIDSSALESALKTIVSLKERLKADRKFCNVLKEDKLLASIRQRFAIPGGACGFDLPNLHYWLQQPVEQKQKDVDLWLGDLALLNDAITVSLSFIRERDQFKAIQATNGFYQGSADDKNELIRVRCNVNEGYYPTLSGNKYRYAIRFMWYLPEPNQSSSVNSDIQFSLAAC